MSENILLIDASPLIYSTYDAVGHLSYGGEPTGMRFGFLRSVRSWTERVKADRTIICFDLPGEVNKAKGEDTYKANRTWTQTKQDMYDQVPDLRELLSLTKYTQIDAPGYEADDILGALARRYGAKGYEVLIATPDHDMLQVVTERVRIFNHKAKKKAEMVLGKQFVLDRYGVPPERFLYYKALVGDTSDNLEGLYKGAEQHKSVARRISVMKEESFVGPNTFKTHWASSWTSLQEDLFERNFELMYLHEPNKVNIIKGSRDEQRLAQEFERLGFKSMKKHLKNIAGTE